MDARADRTPAAPAGPGIIDLRAMEILVALARHRHFARAARACGISQPAFSMRIRTLEDRFGVEIVRRGNRFQGFTPEGEIILGRARGILEDVRTLEQEVRSARGEISGTLTLGVIPTALAFAARLGIALHRTAPGVVLRVESTTSILIQQRIEDGTIDAGITYADGISPEMSAVTPLYEESYVLLAPERIAPRAQGMVTWREAAELPLILLEPQMQNRRILDRMFDGVGVSPRVVAETNDFTTALVMAREGRAAAILPQVLCEALGGLGGTVVLQLVEPEIAKPIILATPLRRPALPLVEALRRTAETIV